MFRNLKSDGEFLLQIYNFKISKYELKKYIFKVLDGDSIILCSHNFKIQNNTESLKLLK